MSKSQLIHLIADYGVGDPAFAEVSQKLWSIDTSIKVNPVPIPRYSTLAAGFWIAQLATVNVFEGLVIFSNTAPRRAEGEDDTKTFKGNFGNFAYTKLASGVIIVAVHVGYCFSFVKDTIPSLHLVNIPNKGSQFRSRDFYPEAVAGLAKGETRYIGEEIPLTTIPAVPQNRIAFIDGFENLKTTVRASQFLAPQEKKITITLNGISREAVVGGRTYHVSDHELSFAPGSSGGEDRFMEIWVRNGSAWETFGKPKIEQEFTIKI